MTMRHKANASLIALSVIFLVALVLHWWLEEPWWTSALIFVAEAGMVGALADWFAVTALFRHPLGMKWIPHTAIVPRNRSKLIDGVVYLVEEQLLNQKMIQEQLSKVNMIEIIIAWVDKKWSIKRAEQLITLLLPHIFRNVSVDKTSKQLESVLVKALSEQQAVQYVRRALRYMVEKGHDQKLLNLLIDAAQKRVLYSDVKPAIKRLLEEKTSGNVGGNWFTNALFSLAKAADAVNFDDAADIIYRDLLLLLAQLKDQDHELRVMLQKQLHELIAVLEEEEVAEALERWKRQFMEELSFLPLIQNLLNAVINGLMPNGEKEQVEPTMLQKWIARLLHQYWNWFKHDQASQQLVEQQLKTFMHHLIQQEHKVIGDVVRSTLDTFSEDRLVEFIESKVDVDLQRIRVNGALIGAVIGGLLYALLYGVYEPLLQLL